jgi:hypothetical protein
MTGAIPHIMFLRLSHTFRTFNSDSSNVQYWNARGSVTTITSNRPECHNALDREVSAELNAPVKEISVDRGCRIVILRAGDTFTRDAPHVRAKPRTSLETSHRIDSASIRLGRALPVKRWNFPLCQEDWGYRHLKPTFNRAPISAKWCRRISQRIFTPETRDSRLCELYAL